ncbi:uncharacterized protein HMPREF1541_10229 [Cyphellophora europaea CBS 101466]|uniref:Uncharacterized protein n=1 Tax=Cyphellophora europaea (strain CBS 101466) TaxID=1220924 RepID=W2S9H1_CYPE1|nr:uncharacterized protein HMPREF1541_10229 [Cyphellophora europaea CBS 101466]ETN44559.1 hypothetical protein HMPREF1541_10229 [Cyphellophora europaea CBS 101466]
MDDTDLSRSPESEIPTSPISPVFSRGGHITDKELILRFKLVDAQRHRGKITQSRYEAKCQALLRLSSNEELLTRVHIHDASLAQGKIDQVGYDKRLRFLIDRLSEPGSLAEDDEQHEMDLKVEEALDKKSRRLYDDPRLPKDSAKSSSPEQRSPEEEKFFASDAEQGWTFKSDRATRTRSAESGLPQPKAYASEDSGASLYGGYDAQYSYGSSPASHSYGSDVDPPDDDDGWRVNIASMEPRGDVERPVRAATSR